MDNLKLAFILITSNMFVLAPATGAWWSLGYGVGYSDNYNIQLSPANRVRALTQRQQRIFRRNPELLQYIAVGAKKAIRECQYQFRNRKWNCSAQNPENVFGKILRIACRETSFTYAITAAGVTHSIARACADGHLNACTCDSRYRGVSKEGWQWGGCSDNIRYANQFSTRFVDATEKGKDFRALVNLHNNEAGRMAVRKNMLLECQCHGVSKACTVKTCWKKLPHFKQVGAVLKEKFDSASMIEFQQNKNRNRYTRSKPKTSMFRPVNHLHKPPGSDDLVYFENSPNFCRRNPITGSVGTRGRECNNTSLGTGGCDLLCCGRGFTSSETEENKHCNCRFFWCCEVKCEKCKSKRMIHRCL